MPHTEETLCSNLVFDGKIIKVCHDKVLLEDKSEAMREVVYHNGGVCVLPLCDDGNVLFVKQFRYPYKQEVLELPAGKLEKGEDPFFAAKRELKEETGAVAAKFVSLNKMYPTPGYCSEIIYMYLAKGLTFSEQSLDEDEFLDVVKIPLDKALEMVKNGEIVDAKTQIAILLVSQM